MIKYALKCSNSHNFESWFRDSAAYDALANAGHLACSVCGDAKVEKAIMAPRVNVPEEAGPKAGPLSQPATPAETALRELRENIEKNAEDVGDRFASEARAIHDGDKPERAIYGQAKLEEAKALIEDGVAVAPLPWMNKTRN